MDLFDEIPLEEQIAEAERELAMRRQVYPRLVGQGKMKGDLAERRTQAMGAIAETLKTLKLASSLVEKIRKDACTEACARKGEPACHALGAGFDIERDCECQCGLETGLLACGVEVPK